MDGRSTLNNKKEKTLGTRHIQSSKQTLSGEGLEVGENRSRLTGAEGGCRKSSWYGNPEARMRTFKSGGRGERGIKKLIKFKKTVSYSLSAAYQGKESSIIVESRPSSPEDRRTDSHGTAEMNILLGDGSGSSPTMVNFG